MYSLLRSKHSTDNFSLIHLWHLHVTMTLLILKSNYLYNFKGCSYLQIILNEPAWLFSLQQERKTVQRTVVFPSKNHMVSPKKPSLPKGCTHTVHLFSFNAHIYESNIGAQCTYICMHTHQFLGICFCSWFYESTPALLKSNMFYWLINWKQGMKHKITTQPMLTKWGSLCLPQDC